MMNDFIATRVKSFHYAFSGLYYAIRTQRNVWIQLVVSVIVLLLALFLEIPFPQLAIIILTISMVLAAECINTAIESLIDLVSPDHHKLAKISKDTAAAAVLVLALGSAFIGLLILGPPLWIKLINFF
jgi:diacylglycerol kinase